MGQKEGSSRGGVDINYGFIDKFLSAIISAMLMIRSCRSSLHAINEQLCTCTVYKKKSGVNRWKFSLHFTVTSMTSRSKKTVA